LTLSTLLPAHHGIYLPLIQGSFCK